MCHIGVVQHALKKTDLALKTLNQAIQNDPENTLCKFHRASINFSTGRPAEALKEFEELKNIVPKESLVYYSIGKVTLFTCPFIFAIVKQIFTTTGSQTVRKHASRAHVL